MENITNQKTQNSWVQSKRMSDEKAEYIIHAAQFYFPEVYEIITINKRLREALERGDTDLEFSASPLS